MSASASETKTPILRKSKWTKHSVQLVPQERGRAETSQSTAVIRALYTPTPRCQGRRELEVGCPGLLYVSADGRENLGGSDAYACGHRRLRRSHGDRGRPGRPAPDRRGHYIGHVSSLLFWDFQLAWLVESRRLTGGQGIASGRECHGGRARHSGHARDGHPCEESSRECAGG